MIIRRARQLAALGIMAAFAAATAQAQSATWPSLTTSEAATIPRSNDVALIVGIEHYAFVPGIPGASENASDWYAYLTRMRGLSPGNVVLIRNSEATIERMQRVALELGKRAEPAATAWFIFIGHGAPSKDGSGGLLVGHDVQQDADSLFGRSIKAEALTIALGQRGPRVVAVLDACFSGRTSRGTELVRGLQPLLVRTEPVNASSRELVFTAARSDQFAGPLPGGDRPAFSYLLLGALRGWGDDDRDGRVTAREAHRYVSEALAATVRDRAQTPELVAGASDDVISAEVGERGPDLASLALTLETRLEGSARADALERRRFKARALAAEGDLTGAREELEAALRLSEPDAQLRLEAARVAENQGDLDGALKHLEHALAVGGEVERGAVNERIAALELRRDRAELARERTALERRRQEADEHQRLQTQRLAEQQQADRERAARRELLSKEYRTLRERNGTMRLTGYGLVGAGALSAIASGGLTLMSAMNNDRIRAGGFANIAQLEAALGEGQRHNALAWLFGIGAAAAAGYGGWLIWTHPEPTAPALTLVAVPGAVSLSGTLP